MPLYSRKKDPLGLSFPKILNLFTSGFPLLYKKRGGLKYNYNKYLGPSLTIKSTSYFGRDGSVAQKDYKQINFLVKL